MHGYALPRLLPGHIIDDSWKILDLLGEGGFGAVYKVENIPKSEIVGALKIESTECKIKVLRMEIMVLEELGKINSIHYTNLLDKGLTEDFSYMVMTLVSSSLQDLRKRRRDQHFSLSTAIRAGIQCLEAIEELHMIGYLHRDIKPGNFAIGRADLKAMRIIYMLDFGMARRFKTKGKVRPPRKRAAFRGTIRYAPLCCHQEKDLSAKDDCEAWFYQQVEMTKGALPWKHLNEKIAVGQWKENIFIESHPVRVELLKGCPAEYTLLLEYIETLTYEETPDYKLMFKTCNDVMTNNGCKYSQPYDWEESPRLSFSIFTLPSYSPPVDDINDHHSMIAMTVERRLQVVI